MHVPDIIIEPWNGCALTREDIVPSLQYLAYKTQKTVTFRWYTVDEGYSAESVSVRVFVKGGTAVTYNPQRVVLTGQTHPLSSGQCGMASALAQEDWGKITDEADQLIGAVDHNRIILPLEITATDNEAARAVLAHVLEKALDLLDFDVAGIMKKREGEFLGHFMTAFHGNVRTRLDLRKDELSQKQREAEQAYYTVLEFERERPVLDEEIALLSKLAERESSPLARSQAKALLQLQSAGSFSEVVLDDAGVLQATTSPVTIEHEGWEFPVGRYEIQVPSNGDVRIKALDEHPNADHPHPHIAQDNRPCLGNIAADLAKLIGKLRYAEALQLLHSFLSTYNPDNPYEKISHFDPSGEYPEEDEDPCEDCDEKCTPHCIFSCDHNVDTFTCQDCCELRSRYCYEECEHNLDHERFHPCEECDSKASEHCYLKCRYNKKWQLQSPCDECEEEDCVKEACPYYATRTREETEHVHAQ